MSEFTTRYESHQALPTEPGIHAVDVHAHAAQLYEIDTEIASAGQGMIAFESPQELIHFLEVEHTSNTFVLNDDAGRHVGCLSVISNPETASLEVLSVGVMPEVKGRGYGKMLMDYAEDLARMNDAAKMFLFTKEDNTSAIGFYEHIGYMLVGRAADHYSQYDDVPRVRLEKQLTEPTA